jgi:hypothetical protein
MNGMVPFIRHKGIFIMTVKELIEKLKKFDENLEVIVSADGGVFEMDDALIMVETWKTKDGKDFELLDINF